MDKKFHHLINGTLTSGKFLEFPANKREATYVYLRPCTMYMSSFCILYSRTFEWYLFHVAQGGETKHIMCRSEPFVNISFPA